MKKTLFVFTDGGARGNPGPAAIGFVIRDYQGKVLAEMGKFIGRATNNVAEYQAIIEALNWIKKNIATKKTIQLIKVFLDSKLAANQLNGFFKIKNSHLRNLVVEVRILERELGGKISYHFIPREKNQQADNLVNKILSS